MKTKLCFLILIATNLALSQNSSSQQSNNSIDTRFSFETSPTSVNSKFSDIGSGFFRGKFIMVSSKKNGGLAKIDPNTHEAYKDLYFLDIDDENGLINRPLLYTRIKKTHYSDGQITFSPDEHIAYYTRSTPENTLEYKLYQSILEDKVNSDWSETILLDINQPNVSIETPFINQAGDKLYFSANYPDSFGGYDLYVSNINADGTLGSPVNLGSKVNTAEDEKYPSLSLDDSLLFFASKGHESLGGYDLYRSIIATKGFSSPKNLGPTINTAQDDISFFFETQNKGYVSSNKSGGVGSYDIYAVKIHEIIQNLSGFVSDIDTQNKLPFAQLTLLDEDGLELESIQTGKDGAYKFTVEPSENYTITISKAGYIPTTVSFVSNQTNNQAVYIKDIAIKNTTPEIKELQTISEKIYFKFDKWKIQKNAYDTLDKVVKILNEYPEIKLNVDGYTDNIGSESYNLRLSKKRAKSTVSYLIKQGISKDRLVPQGFGESNPLIDCKNHCTKEDYQTNRRIQFVVIK